MKRVVFFSDSLCNRKLIIVIIISCIFIQVCCTQDTLIFHTRAKPEIKRHWIDLGIGAGLIDYGGLGMKLSFLPIAYFSIDGSLGFLYISDYYYGFHSMGLGWNVGTTLHILPSTSRYLVRPNLKIMYGVNAGTYVIGKSDYNKIFTGWTPGIGIEMMFGKKRKFGWDYDFNIPIKSSAFHDQYLMIKQEHDIYEIRKPWPVILSCGFHFEF